MLHWAVGVTPTLDAAAAIGCTARTQRGRCALSVLVALVARQAIVVAPVRADRTISLDLARLEAVIDYRITNEACGTVHVDQARDAAVALVAPGERRVRAVRIFRALGTLAGDAMQIGGALRMNAAATPAGEQARGSCAPRARTTDTCGLPTGSRERPSKPPAARARHIELEASIASLSAADRSCNSQQDEGRAPRSAMSAGGAHGASVSCLASPSAKPRG